MSSTQAAPQPSRTLSPVAQLLEDQAALREAVLFDQFLPVSLPCSPLLNSHALYASTDPLSTAPAANTHQQHHPVPPPHAQASRGKLAGPALTLSVDATSAGSSPSCYCASGASSHYALVCCLGQSPHATPSVMIQSRQVLSGQQACSAQPESSFEASLDQSKWVRSWSEGGCVAAPCMPDAVDRLSGQHQQQTSCSAQLAPQLTGRPAQSSHAPGAAAATRATPLHIASSGQAAPAEKPCRPFPQPKTALGWAFMAAGCAVGIVEASCSLLWDSLQVRAA